MATQDTSLDLSSPAFDDGGRLPRWTGRSASDENPPLTIHGVPPEAASLAILLEDPDAEAVAGTVWTHWLVYDIPPDRRTIPRDWDPETAAEGRNDFEETGYGGPSPPDGEHTYVFRLYALSEEPSLFEHPTAEDLQRSIKGLVVAEDELRGTYPAWWA